MANKIRLERVSKLFWANKDYVSTYSAVLLWHGQVNILKIAHNRR